MVIGNKKMVENKKLVENRQIVRNREMVDWNRSLHQPSSFPYHIYPHSYSIHPRSFSFHRLRYRHPKQDVQVSSVDCTREGAMVFGTTQAHTSTEAAVQ